MKIVFIDVKKYFKKPWFQSSYFELYFLLQRTEKHWQDTNIESYFSYTFNIKNCCFNLIDGHNLNYILEYNLLYLPYNKKLSVKNIGFLKL